MLHWFNLEVWGPIWPNLAASLISFTVAYFVAHRKVLRELERRELAHLKRHDQVIEKVNEIQASLPPSGSSGLPG